jgi:hypothetical protein
MKLRTLKHWLQLAAICTAGTAYAKVPSTSGVGIIRVIMSSNQVREQWQLRGWLNGVIQ